MKLAVSRRTPIAIAFFVDVLLRTNVTTGLLRHAHPILNPPMRANSKGVASGKTFALK
jgi:hypothetical protein